jgi:hypothetical protein
MHSTFVTHKMGDFYSPHRGLAPLEFLSHLTIVLSSDRQTTPLSAEAFQRFQFFDVLQVFTGRGQPMAANMTGPRPAEQDESPFERNCSLALARRSALSSCFLAVDLLLPKFVSASRPFAPLPASQICSPLSRAHQLVPAVARRIQKMPKTLWLALGSQTRSNRWPCCVSETSSHSLSFSFSRLPRRHFRDRRSDRFPHDAGFASGFSRAWSALSQGAPSSDRHYCDRACLPRSCWRSLGGSRPGRRARSPPPRARPIVAAALPHWLNLSSGATGRPLPFPHRRPFSQIGSVRIGASRYCGACR